MAKSYDLAPLNLSQESLFLTLLVVLQALFWCFYAYFSEKNIFYYLISALAGSAAFLIPTISYIFLVTYRKNNELTASKVIFDGIKALFIKYLLFAFIVVFIFKYLKVDPFVIFSILIFDLFVFFIRRFLRSFS